MCKYPMCNIYIEYDGIQCECYLSKNKIKKAVYNCVYGGLGNNYIKSLGKYNVRIYVSWHYGWDEPVVYIPAYVDDKGECVANQIGLGKYLGWR